MLEEAEVKMLPEAGDLPPDCLVKHPRIERRVRVRYSANLVTLCQKTDACVGDFWWLAQVQNISALGIALVLSHRFEPESILVIEPTVVPPRVARSLEVRVVRAEPHAEEGWCIGCEFTQDLSDEDLKAMLE